MKHYLLGLGSILILPLTALAQVGSSQATNFSTIATKIESVIFKPLVGLVIAWALVLFLWALTQYLKSGDAKGKEDAAKTIGWGILILAVMVSVWGLVNILVNTFTGGAASIPLVIIPQM